MTPVLFFPDFSFTRNILTIRILLYLILNSRETVLKNRYYLLVSMLQDFNCFKIKVFFHYNVKYYLWYEVFWLTT